jgi:D-amino peptidase
MRRTSLQLGLFAVLCAPALSQTESVKVFISVDMEGLAGVVGSSDVSRSGADYAHFRKLMADETNAAIRGALIGGATEIVVRDSHGSKTNLLPGDLLPEALLLRGATTGPKNMMEGIDETFDAVVFIGYHARAGTPEAILEHTSSGNVIDMAINGISMPEAGYNALVAGLYGVPVVFVAGDLAFVEQARELLGPVEAVATKEEINGGALSLSPEAACEKIHDGVANGLRDRGKREPYRMEGPYTLVLEVRREREPFPGARRTGEGKFTFTSDSLLKILDAFNAMK